MKRIDFEFIEQHFPPRPDNAHKGTMGTLCALTGSCGFSGAAILSAREACGGFTSRMQLCEIGGIGTKLMQRIMTEFEIQDEITEPDQPEPLPDNFDSGAESSAEDSYYINVYDLNTVTREQLLTIPEMTESKADAILAMRGELKGYYSVYELTLADGISGEYFEQVLSRCLYVEGDPNSHPAEQELPEN